MRSRPLLQRALLTGTLLVLASCAPGNAPARGAGPALVPATPHGAAQGAAASGPTAPRTWDQSLRLAGGETCFHWLGALGIAHERLPPTPGVVDPVRVTGPIGGITFRSQGKSEIVCDCRMVLALDWTARALHPLGVTAIEHSGAYAYRTTKRGRPSLHARGLAIDVHGIHFGQYTHWVKHHYLRSDFGSCSNDTPALNRVECELRALGLFRELLTPNSDADHHDHLHLGISPLP